jgi:hypothetical protein
MQIDKEFKQELSLLPEKEKDKMVLKLLRRDKKLAKRLHYELIGDFSKEDLQNEFEESLISTFKRIKAYNFKPGYLSMALRGLSSEISSYLFTTKDKYGEALMNLFLMNKSFEYFSEEVDKYSGTDKGRKLAVYIVNKTFNLRVAINKQDPDLYTDFAEELRTLGKYFGKNDGIMQTCIYHGFDPNWLLDRDIPENIESIQKDLRSRGFLK